MSYVDKYGYIRTGGRKFILMHRLVMEEYLGRKLDDNECVHHINGDTLDNRIKNLQIINKSEHMTLHRRKKHKQHHDIEWLKKQLSLGIKKIDIARKCGVSNQAIVQFIRRHIKGVPYAR